MSIRVFWLEPTRFVRVSLRAFEYSTTRRCTTGYGCDASVVIHERESRRLWIEDRDDGSERVKEGRIKKADPRWPARCERCGEPVTVRQVWARRLYSGAPDGKLYTIHDAPIGAMWDAVWMHDYADGWWKGADGISLVVRTPGGDWCVDSQASNCTRREDRTHKCWCRHGDPRKGEVHVDKVGDTCAAGAGSIVMGNYHGFLHHCHLIPC